MGIETSVRTIPPDVTVVAISGRLSLGAPLISIELALKKLVAEGARKIVIDLTKLDRIDSAGIGMLIMCSGLLDKNGGRLRIAGASGLVARTFDIVQIGRTAGLDPDVETSCRNFGV